MRSGICVHDRRPSELTLSLPSTGLDEVYEYDYVRGSSQPTVACHEVVGARVSAAMEPGGRGLLVCQGSEDGGLLPLCEGLQRNDECIFSEMIRHCWRTYAKEREGIRDEDCVHMQFEVELLDLVDHDAQCRLPRTEKESETTAEGEASLSFTRGESMEELNLQQ